MKVNLVVELKKMKVILTSKGKKKKKNDTDEERNE
jgi:hypothetical protein